MWKIMVKWVDLIINRQPKICGSIEIKTNSELKEADFENIYEPHNFQSLFPPILFLLPKYGEMKILIFKYFDRKKKM